MQEEMLDQKTLDEFFANIEFTGLSLEEVSKILNIPLDKIKHLKMQYDLSQDVATAPVRSILTGKVVIPALKKNTPVEKIKEVPTWLQNITHIKTKVLNWFSDLNL